MQIERISRLPLEDSGGCFDVFDPTRRCVPSQYWRDIDGYMIRIIDIKGGTYCDFEHHTGDLWGYVVSGDVGINRRMHHAGEFGLSSLDSFCLGSANSGRIITVCRKQSTPSRTEEWDRVLERPRTVIGVAKGLIAHRWQLTTGRSLKIEYRSVPVGGKLKCNFQRHTLIYVTAGDGHLIAPHGGTMLPYQVDAGCYGFQPAFEPFVIKPHNRQLGVLTIGIKK